MKQLKVLRVRPAEVEIGDIIVGSLDGASISSMTQAGGAWSYRDLEGRLVASRSIFAESVPVFRHVENDDCDPHGVARRFTVVSS